jgi:hypothetical protein
VVRIVALPVPNDRERCQWYFQRYVTHLPACGEIVLFDRSWYNRAGIERVMGFCTEDEVEEFFRTVPGFDVRRCPRCHAGAAAWTDRTGHLAVCKLTAQPRLTAPVTAAHDCHLHAQHLTGLYRPRPTPNAILVNHPAAK